MKKSILAISILIPLVSGASEFKSNGVFLSREALTIDEPKELIPSKGQNSISYALKESRKMADKINSDKTMECHYKKAAFTGENGFIVSKSLFSNSEEKLEKMKTNKTRLSEEINSSKDGLDTLKALAELRQMQSDIKILNTPGFAGANSQIRFQVSKSVVSAIYGDKFAELVFTSKDQNKNAKAHKFLFGSSNIQSELNLSKEDKKQSSEEVVSTATFTHKDISAANVSIESAIKYIEIKHKKQIDMFLKEVVGCAGSTADVAISKNIESRTKQLGVQ